MSFCMCLRSLKTNRNKNIFITQFAASGILEILNKSFTSADLLHIRNMSKFSHKMIRTAVRVYQPGETIPDFSKGRTVKMPLTSMDSKINKSKFQNSTDEKTPIHTDSSSRLFSSLMGEIMVTKSRNIIALEGTRMVVEGLKAGLTLKGLFITKSTNEIPTAINNFIQNSREETENENNKSEDISTGAINQDDQNRNENLPYIKAHKISSKLMQTWSSLTTPPGVIGVFNRPKIELKDCKFTIPVTVVCDNVREPGNLGAILRSAAAAGCKRILLTKGCVDPWQSKVLRAGSGSHFCLPITTDIPVFQISSYVSLDSSNDIGNKQEIEVEQPTVSQQESEAPPTKDSNEKDCVTDSKSKIGIFIADNSDTDLRSSVPIHCYTDVDFNNYDNVYVILGGETEGLSKDALSIAAYLSESYKPKPEVVRVRIPMQLNMESLNVAHAFAIIVFEILRQRRHSSIK